MNQYQRLKIFLEILGWALTLLILCICLFPLYKGFDTSYFFWVQNILFILIFITFTRYIFLLPHTWIAKRTWAKFLFFFISIPIAFKLVETLGLFNMFCDEQSPDGFIQSMRNGMTTTEQLELVRYTINETFFFGVASTVSAIILPFRMVISYWRQVNHEIE
jgi:hypothetical protein